MRSSASFVWPGFAQSGPNSIGSRGPANSPDEIARKLVREVDLLEARFHNAVTRT